jgi:flagellar hook protein FlgE
MGIFGALTTSVAGLRAQSYALENISGNIANSQTTAFKRIDTSFLDLIPDTGVNNQLAGSVTTASRETNTVQGDVQSASVSTYMAINGNGFFVVQKPGSFSDNQPVFSGVDNYTRRGDFALDKNGYLVNGAGYYVEGVPIDPATGNMTGSVPQVLKFANDFLPAVPTSVVSYRANLASYPLTTKHDNSIPGSELLQPADFASGNPRTLGTPATPYGDATIAGAARNNKLTTPTPITTSTLLSGGTNSNSLTTNFTSADTITINLTSGGTTTTETIAFYDSSSGGSAGSAANTTYLDLASATVGNLLSTIDGLSGAAPGTPSTINSSGAITLHSGITNDLSITASNATAFGALGLTTPLNLARNGGGTAGTGRVLGGDLQAFINESVSGGAVTAYDISGSPVSLQLRWAKVDSSSLGAGHTDTWNMFYQVNSSATGTDLAWQNVNTDFTFSPNGQMTPAIGGITLTAPTIGGVPLGNISINFGAGGVTQFADANGNVKVNQIQQDGFPAGSLQTVSIGQNGRVVGNYSNGRNIDLAQISVATFNGTNFLKRIDGGAFEATDQSGQALYGSGGTIVGSSLENSNTDIADEFTKLIVTQQAYSANTKVITTSNSMVQDLLNVLR